MKTLKLMTFIGMLLSLLVVTRCSDDDPKPVELGTLSGTVTYPNTAGTQAPAVGATVTLMGTSGVLYTVTDEDGIYTFANLEADDYDMHASYFVTPETAARVDGLNFATASDVAVTMTSADLTQNLTLVSVGQSGSDIIKIEANYAWDGDASAYKQPANPAWQFDNGHSLVTFEFPYRGEQGDFTGSFKQMHKFVVTFDPANLSSSSIDVEVDMASVDTRTPGGRDNRTTVADNPTFSPTAQFTELGCIAGTFGITADNATPTEGAPQPITTDPDRYAKFSSTSISKYGDGYLAKGNLVWRGFTVPVELWFKQIPAWLDASNNRTYSGFEGKFLMDAKGDFNIISSSVNDAILRIQISIVGYTQG